MVQCQNQKIIVSWNLEFRLKRMSSNCEVSGEPAENEKDTVFVTITGPAKWLAGPSLLKADATPAGATFHTLLRNELTTLQTVQILYKLY